MLIGLHKTRNLETTIYAPNLPFEGHSITNLARHQLHYAKIKTRNALKKEEFVSHSTNRNVSFFHVGNSEHSFNVLDSFQNSSADLKILIIHDTDLSGLLWHAVRIKRDMRVFHNILSKQTILFLLKKITEGSLEQGQKTSLFVNSILKSQVANTKIVLHNTSGLRLPEDQDIRKLFVLALPIGFHYLKPLPIVGSNPASILLMSLGLEDLELIENLKVTLSDLSAKKAFRTVLVGTNVDRFKEIFKNIPYLRVLSNVSNENWKILLKRADVSLKIGTGRRGESSGFLRDCVLYSKAVLGDEDSRVLRKFSNYSILSPDCNTHELVEKIGGVLEGLPKFESTDDENQKSLKASKSLEEYFNSLDRIVSDHFS